MKCSLKKGFINILLIIFIVPSEGTEFPLFLRTSLVLEKPMNFKAAINRLQDLDSFPGDGDSEKKLHKIVKKQMAFSDYKDKTKNKRSVFDLPRSFGCTAGDGDNIKCKDDGKIKEAIKNSALFKPIQLYICNQQCDYEMLKEFLMKIKDFAKDTQSLLTKRTKVKTSSEKDENCAQTEIKIKDKKINECLCKRYVRIPDEKDYRCYYECESKPFGCMKLKHKRCPEGQFFSFKYLKCLKAPKLRKIKRNKRLGLPSPRKNDVLDPSSEDPEPANEWLDANQGVNQKIPPEFKPKKAPGLKIYHLSVEKKPGEMLLKKRIQKRHLLGRFDSTRIEYQRKLGDPAKGTVKRHGARHHPRSFLIRINKKEGKDNQGQSITENDENDSDEEDEESDEEDDDEESEDEDEETEEEAKENNENENSSHKDTLKDLFKSAKAAMTSRAKFNEGPSNEPDSSQKGNSCIKSKKSEQSTESVNKNKKVLIDANIKVDSTISNALKYILKSKTKDKGSSLINDEEALISDRGSQDQLDPELIRMYEHLIRNNPRVKRYFLANRAKQGN